MHTQFYTGIVENREDPLRLGRCQVRVFGVHSESLDDVPTSSLPWAIPLMPITSASLSGIGDSPTGVVPGTMVVVYFQDGESKQMPVMIGSVPGIPQNQHSGLREGAIDEVVNLGGVPPPTTQTQTNVTTSDGSQLLSGDGTPVQVGTPSVMGQTVSWHVNNSPITACMSLLEKYESFRAEPYRDSAGIPTIGYGTTIYPDGSKVKMSDASITKQKAIEFKTEHIKKNVYPYLVSKVNVVITEGMFNALCSFVYNIGGGAFGNSTLCRMLNSNDYAGASAQFQEWTKAGGQTLAGLVTRRKAEQNLFDSNGYPGNVQPPAEQDVVEPNSSEPKDTSSRPTDAQMGSVITTAASLGFKDHSGKFPLVGLLKEPDTNRLFRKITKGTLVERKKSRRRLNLQSATDKVTFSEPRPAYNASYPYNRGFFSESGHALEFDDTPGSERIHMYHKTGTYTEIDKFGNQVNRIVGDTYSITDRNGYLYIDGTARIIVGSDVKLAVGGNLDIAVSGDVNYDIGGNLNFKVAGSMNTNVSSRISTRSGSFNAIDGSQVFLNCGRSNGQPQFVQKAKVSLDYPPQVPENSEDADMLYLEEREDAAQIVVNQQATGKVTQEEIGKGAAATPEQTDETPPTPPPQNIPKSCSMFTSDVVPANLQISKYFTIGMLSSGAAVTKDSIVAQRGITIPAIACNLKMLAENCLDPIREKYPNMFVTSGFRRGSGTSQHELGQAADMQFKNVSKSEYFEIAQWIKSNVLFDKLLLEYKTTGSGMPWIHIAYRDAPRKEVYTFMNHANRGAGLQDLSKA